MNAKDYVERMFFEQTSSSESDHAFYNQNRDQMDNMMEEEEEEVDINNSYIDDENQYVRDETFSLQS